MSESEEVSIKIKRTNNNNLVEVKITKSANILELKKVIAEKSGIETNRQSLVYKGKILSDDKTLNEYQVENDHTILLVEKLISTQSNTSTNTSSNSSTSNTARPFTMQAGLGTPGFINTDILRHPVGGNLDLNTAMNLMSNPQVQQAMNEVGFLIFIMSYFVRCLIILKYLTLF
jgi:ubiquilin